MTALKPYLASFDILSSDFKRLTEYVEPVDANLKVYSHRLYELLLRACTEFESICKDTLEANGSKKLTRVMTILDYKTLESSLHLENRQVGVLLWRPVPKYLQPFANWSSASPPLLWYKAYNSVKHNRNAEFSQATLESVCSALAGVFTLLAVLDVIPKNHGVQERDAPEGFRERVYPGQLFTLSL